MQPWQQEMRSLKIQHFRSISKEFYRVCGGDNMIVRPYSDVTPSGLQNCIVDYLGYHGWITDVGPLVKGFISISGQHGDKRALITISIKKLKTRKGQIVTDPHTPLNGQIYYQAYNMQSFMDWFKQTFK